jgi:hypothetical protein
MYNVQEALKYAFKSNNQQNQIIIIAINIVLVIIAFIVGIIFSFTVGYIGNSLEPIITESINQVFQTVANALGYILITIFAFRVRENLRDDIEEIPNYLENLGQNLTKGGIVWLVKTIFQLPFGILTLLASIAYGVATTSIMEDIGVSGNNIFVGSDYQSTLPDEFFTLSFAFIGFIIIISIIQWVYSMLIVIPATYNIQKRYNLQDGFDIPALINLITNNYKLLFKYGITELVSYLVFLILFIILALPIVLVAIPVLGILIVCCYLIFFGLVIFYMLIILQYFYIPHLQGQLFRDIKNNS